MRDIKNKVEETKVDFGKLKTRNDVLRYEMKSDGKYVIFHHSGDWYTALGASAWICETKLGIKNKHERYQYDEGFQTSVKLLSKKIDNFVATVKTPMKTLGASIVHEDKNVVVFSNPVKVTRKEILENAKKASEQEKTIEAMLMPDRVMPEKARRLVEIHMELSSAVGKDLPKGTKGSIGERLFRLANEVTEDEVQIALAQTTEERNRWKKKMVVDIQVFSAVLMGTFNAGMLTNKRVMKIGRMLRDILHEGR